MNKEDTLLKNKLLNLFPKELNYRFVDDIIEFNEESVVGVYTFPEDAQYYKGHFPDYPITPGSVLMECAVQIGTVVLGKILFHYAGLDVTANHVLLISSKITFKNMVKPNDKVKVTGRLTAYKKALGVLRTKIEMVNYSTGELICNANFTCKVMNDDEIRNY